MKNDKLVNIKPSLVPIESAFSAGISATPMFLSRKNQSTRSSNIDLLALAESGMYSPAQLLDILIDAHPDASKALNDVLNIANTKKSFAVVDDNGVIIPASQKWFRSFLNKLNYGSMNSPVQGAVMKPIDTVARQTMLSLVTRGASLWEIMVDRNFNPQYFKQADPDYLVYKQNQSTGELIPYWNAGTADPVKIDSPRIIHHPFDARIDDPYGVSPFLPVLTAIWFQLKVLVDLAQILKNIFPKTDIELDEQVLMNHARSLGIHDTEKLKTYINDTISNWRSKYKEQQAEDGYVHTSSVKIKTVESKSGGSWFDVRPLMQVIDQQIVAAVKSMPTLLGRTANKTSTAGGNDMEIFGQFCGLIQKETVKVLEVMSTRALWLSGRRGFVQVKFNPIDLRSETEIEQWISTKIVNECRLFAIGVNAFDETRTALRRCEGALPKLTAPQRANAEKKMFDLAGIDTNNQKQNVKTE